MSIRTIIEVNHDFLNALERNPYKWNELLADLRGAAINEKLNKGETPQPTAGVRVLAQCHHSNTVSIDIS